MDEKDEAHSYLGLLPLAPKLHRTIMRNHAAAVDSWPSCWSRLSKMHACSCYQGGKAGPPVPFFVKHEYSIKCHRTGLWQRHMWS